MLAQTPLHLPYSALAQIEATASAVNFWIEV